MLQIVTLHLARNAEFPTGSLSFGYEIVAPIDAAGHLDAAEWKRLKAACRVRRFRPEEGERRGSLHHRAGGASGATWLIHYDAQDREEKGVHWEGHRFAEGEYISLQDAAGHLNTFKLVRMQPVVARAGSPAAGAASVAQTGGLIANQPKRREPSDPIVGSRLGGCD